MQTGGISEQVFKNPAWKAPKNCGNEFETARQLAIYRCHDKFEMSELDPGAVEPVRRAIKKWHAELDAHCAKHGD